MLNLPEHIRAALQSGNLTKLTSDDLKRVAEQIEAMEKIAKMPGLLGAIGVGIQEARLLREELQSLRAEIRRAVEKRVRGSEGVA